MTTTATFSRSTVKTFEEEALRIQLWQQGIDTAAVETVAENLK